jgi:pilus assembly protein CpaE
LKDVQYNAGIFNVAVITVGVDPNIADQILQAAADMPWIVTSVDFEQYISAVKRPLFTQQVRATNGCLAIVDFDSDPQQAVETTRYLQQTFAGKISIVALSSSKENDLLLLAMRAGCSEFLRKPFDELAFSETLGRLDLLWSSDRVLKAPNGAILAFFGAKGGVGTTTLAVHLAMYLAQCHGKRTLLIDGNPQLGHVCVYLGIDGTNFHFHEVVRNVSRLDSELLKGFVAKHSSGLEVLSSPDTCGGMVSLDPDSINLTLEFLRGEYDYIIIDTPTTLDENNLAIIEAASKIYLVATPEIGAIRDLSRYVDNLMQSSFTSEKMDIVINRFSSSYAVSVEQIEKAIRLPIAFKLPNSYTELVRSVNLGEPISPSRKTEFSVQFIKWANSLVGATAGAEPPAKEKSLFALFK